MTELEKAARMALEFCEFCWRDVSMNDYALEKLEQTTAALTQALATTEPVQAVDERAAFEDWAKARSLPLDGHGGHYSNIRTRNNWLGWQARASQHATTEPDEDDDKWRDVALRFDKHRMQALWHLQAMLKDPEKHADIVRQFLKDPTHPAAATTEPDTCRKRPRCALADPCAWLKSRTADQPVLAEPSNGFVWVAGHWVTAEQSEWRDRLTVNLLRYSSGITKNQIRALIAHAVDGVEPDPALFATAERKGKPVAKFDEMKGRPVLLPDAPMLKHGDLLYTSPQVPEGVQWLTVAEHGLPAVGEEVIGGHWYTDPWLKPECATRFVWCVCQVVADDHPDFPDGKRWHTFGPAYSHITHWARLNLPAIDVAQKGE